MREPTLQLEISGLVVLERDLNKAPQALEEALSGIGDDIALTWKVKGIAEGAVDSYDFVSSIAKHKLVANEFVVDTSNNEEVIYSDIIERGRHDRPNYPDRHLAEKTVDYIEAQDFVGKRVFASFDKNFNG